MSEQLALHIIKTSEHNYELRMSVRVWQWIILVRAVMVVILFLLSTIQANQHVIVGDQETRENDWEAER